MTRRRLPRSSIKHALAMVWLLGTAGGVAAQGWEPTQPIEIVVPAGTGGGADQMARFVQAMAAKHQLTRQPVQVALTPFAAARCRASFT